MSGKERLKWMTGPIGLHSNNLLNRIMTSGRERSHPAAPPSGSSPPPPSPPQTYLQPHASPRQTPGSCFDAKKIELKIWKVQVQVGVADPWWRDGSVSQQGIHLPSATTTVSKPHILQSNSYQQCNVLYISPHLEIHPITHPRMAPQCFIHLEWIFKNQNKDV